MLKYDDVHEPAAQGRSTPSGTRCWRARTCTSRSGSMIDEVVDGLRRRGHRPRASPRSGTWTSCGRRSGSCTRSTRPSSELVEEAGGDARACTAEILTERIQEDAQAAYDRREEELDARGACASWSAGSCCRCWTASGASTCTRWTTCRRASACAAMAQRDPLIEYQREGYDMFTAMMDGIKEESVGNLFNLAGRGPGEPDRRARRARTASGSARRCTRSAARCRTRCRCRRSAGVAEPELPSGAADRAGGVHARAGLRSRSALTA